MMETSCNEKNLLATSNETSYSKGIDDDWHVEAILGPEYLAPICTVDAYVDLIVDKRQTSRLVQDLQRLSPIPSLRHLKRVNPDGRIIIRLADLPQNESPSSQLLLSEDRHPTSKCCALATDTKEKDSTAKKRSFLETSSCGKTKNNHNTPFSNEITCSTKGLLLTQESEKGTEERSTLPTCHSLLPVGLNPEGLRGAMERIAVPATAPLTRKQFLEAQQLWACNFHPSRGVEAALAPGAGLSAVERAPLLATLRLCAKRSSESSAAAVHPRDGRIVAMAVDARGNHPLQHAAMRLVDLVARSQGGGIWAPLPGEEVTEVCSSRDSKDRDSLPYLCTGLDIVMTREPCAMCAMALTHARARRVFFSEDSPHNGVLYSHSPPMHTLPGLNHRFSVFRAPLPKSAKT